MNRIAQIQESLQQQKLDGWLFYSFRGSDPYAANILQFQEEGHFTRRWLYFIPAKGEAVKIVHSIEKDKLDFLPGKKLIYLAWQKLHENIKEAIGQNKNIAMQYSPNNDIPYVACVDAGTVELIRSFGVNVVSSAELIQKFESLLSDEQKKSHIYAAQSLRQIVDLTFAFAAEKAAGAAPATEYELQQFMLERFTQFNLTTSSPPVAAVNQNSANPHYDPLKEPALPVKQGDFLLIDLWAKQTIPHSVYADITWTAYLGSAVPEKYNNIFAIAAKARDEAFALVKRRLKARETVHGWEVDDAARNVITAAGYGQYFIHRTGHSIGEAVHGTGVHIDNLETKDSRKIVNGCCFSLEPGIYLEGDFGIRTEIDVLVENDDANIHGLPIQERVVTI